MPLGLEVPTEFSRERRLSRALKSREHDDGWWGFGELQLCRFTTENPDKFLVDDLNNLLSWVEGFVDVIGDCPLANGGGEVLDHIQRNVRLEECSANFANRTVDIGRAELAFRSQRRKCRREPFRE